MQPYGSMNGMNGLAGSRPQRYECQLGQTEITIATEWTPTRKLRRRRRKTQEGFQHKIGCHVLFDRFRSSKRPEFESCFEAFDATNKIEGISAVGPGYCEMQGDCGSTWVVARATIEI